MPEQDTTQVASSADIKRLLGHIDAHTVAEIRESGATIDEIAAADIRTTSWRPRESMLHWPAGLAVIVTLAGYVLLLLGSRRRSTAA